MNFVRMNAETEASLPQLRGGLLWTYRAFWCALALTATGFLILSLFQPANHPIITALRLVKGVVLIAMTAILFHRRPRDPVAALLSLAMLVWTITSSVDFSSASAASLLLDRVRFLLFVFALLLFPDGQWRPAWTRMVAACSVAVFALGAAEIVGLLSSHLFLPLAIGCVLAAIVALLARFRTSTSAVTRQQLKWVALGLMAGISLILGARAGAALSATSPVLGALPAVWEGMFQLGIIIVAFGFLVSLLRYRLFDAEAAISRSAALAGLTLALVATFAGTEAAIEWAGQQYLGMGIGNVSAAMAAAVAAVLLNPLHDRISGWAEHRFQRDLVTLKHELPRILDDLAAGATPKEVAAVALLHIDQAVHSIRSALVVPRSGVIGANGVSLKHAGRWLDEIVADADVPLHRDREDPVFPIRIELAFPLSGESGWLVLGPRPDGSLYGREDLNAIDAVRPAIRHALTWALAREAMDTQQQRRWDSLRAELSELHRLFRTARAPTV